jgi:heme-degrading monooxygenase HmoA
MAIMMITEQAGAGPELLDGLREQGLFDKMKSAPGFLGHWSGTTDKGLCAIEMWESPEAHQAWFEATIKPILPPGADEGYSYVHLLYQVQPS